MTERVTGYILLIIGLIIIVFAAINVFAVFTGQAQPVQLFHFQSVSLDLGSSLGLPKSTSPATELLSARDLNQMSNIGAQLLLMGFLAGVGQKIAALGVDLLRPIVVKSKEG
ncbi:hypothetical protein HY440_03590 [Candidatus Microgenomates bacterium]|nr:hypothetical protein [Candidatus Microgenomates bacterium]